MLQDIFAYQTKELVLLEEQQTRYTLIAFLTIGLGVFVLGMDVIMTNADSTGDSMCSAFESQLASVVVKGESL